jgi:hypothetical protein
MTSNDIFTWLLASGGLVFCLSWLVDRWPWFLAQGPEVKHLVFVALGVVIGLGIYAAQLYVPASFWLVADPWILKASGLIVILGSAKAYHQLTKPQ